MANNSALSKAMGEGTKGLSAKQKEKALDQALDKLIRTEKRELKTKDTLSRVGGTAVHTMETAGTFATGELAEGYFGDKIQPGGFDLRFIPALVADGIGFSKLAEGKPSGGHLVAAGNGFLFSALGSYLRKAGQAMRKKREESKGETEGEAQAPEAIQIPQQTTAGEEVAGPIREIVLTPEPEPLPAKREGRFVRARKH